MESKSENFNAQNQQHSPAQIVCIYAEHDNAFYRELQTHLILWHTKGDIRWLELTAGDDVEQTLLAFVQRADLILLLISPSFFATMVFHKAMESAIAEHVRRGVPVVPIVARAFDWKESVCGSLRALPDNDKPIAEWEHSERAYENIRAGLARFLPRISTNQPIRPRLFQARDLPKGYVPRPKAFDTIKRQLLSQRGGQTTAITTALRGAGGFGKTTLAIALCHDSEIQEAFPDGILWVDLGEQPPKPVDVLNKVLSSLNLSLPRAITPEEALDHWRTALQELVCLLVIDDVWQDDALEPLLEGGPRCVRLITTRNDQVLRKETTRIWVDAMEQQEAITVLCEGLPDEIRQLMHQRALETLVTRLNCWPLLLTLARGLLYDQVDYGRPLASALEELEQAYQTRGVIAFDLSDENERERAAGACLETSLRHLEEFTSRRYHAVKRYQELAIFPEDTDIPLSTLQRFWKGTGKLERLDTDDLCMRLHRLSLLLSCDLRTGTIRLHDVMRSYLVQRADSYLSALHARFLDVSKLGLRRWAKLPANDRYLWHHLIWHLCRTDRTDELVTTLTDLGYLTRKIVYMGVAALEADLLLAAMQEEATSVTNTSWLFSSLYRMIVRISHLLRQVTTEAEVGGLLLSHVGLQPPFAEQRRVFERELPRPFLTALHPLPVRASSALLRTLHGHSYRVTDCAVSPDGCTIISASGDRTLKVWDAATGAQRLSLSGHTKYVKGCAVSPDGQWIVSASDDKTLKVWDAQTGAELLTLSGHSDVVKGCAVSPDGRWIISASDDKTLKVWDAQTGAELLTLSGHTSLVNSCAVSPDGQWIVSGSDDKTIKVWNAQTGAELLTLSGHRDAVRDCAVSPNGRTIVSASYDGTLKVWDAQTGAELLTLSGHRDSVRSCAVSPDGSFIVSASLDGTLKVWDTRTGAERQTLSGHTYSANGCVVSPDGRWIVSASDDHTLKVWDVAAGTESFSHSSHRSLINGCAVSPDGQWIVSALHDGTLKVWDVQTGAELLTLSGHRDSVRSCAVSPDGRTVVSTSWDKTLKVWDVVTGTSRLTLSGHTSLVNSCAVSPDGQWIVSASDDKTLKVWDAQTGALRLTLSSHTSLINGCAVSPDGQWIVSAFHDSTLKVWDAQTGAELLTLSGHRDSVRSCAVSPDGRTIISASWDKTLKVWDAVTGIERFTLSGHSNPVRNCAVSPDGRTIVSTSRDTLKVWNMSTGQCLLTFPTDGTLSSCAFHPDGEHLVACGAQGMYFLRLMQ